VSRSITRIIAHVQGELEIVDDVPQAFAALVAREAPRSIALSGGDTARRCYELLATADVSWRGVDAYFGDERWVPVRDPDSNEGMARVTFLDQVQPHSVHSMYEAGSDPESAAAAYDELMRSSSVELVHLGLGDDGHTASLFPGSPVLEEADRLVVSTGDDDHPHRRITLTFPALARAPLVVFTVSGAEKCEAFARVRRGEDVPANRVRAERIVWIVDRAAAGSSRSLRRRPEMKA
jgi:6-phosphogluconolactonase